MESILDKFIEVRKGSIVDAAERWEVDAIVNAAHPTLRRGEKPCVDAAINEKMDQLSGQVDCLQEIITEEWNAQHKEENPIIKCKRGDILVTSGGCLCEYIIHTVGPKSDKDSRWPDVCSSSCINTLRSCYRKITLEVLQNVGIKTVAIPVISAGNYKLDFELAFKVSISEVYNTLLEQKKKDPEMFGYSGLEKIYFVINDNENMKVAQAVMEQYRSIIKEEKRIVTFKTWESQAQYFKEIQLYDSQKGYFSIAKLLRMSIVGIRFFSLYTYLKDWVGKSCWESRRQVVEFVAFVKMLLPIIALVLMEYYGKPEELCIIGTFIVGYGLLDTVTYLLELIVLADIQNPSANIIRSMIMLFFNYFEAVFDIAVIGYAWIPESIELDEMMAFVLLGENLKSEVDALKYIWLSYLNSAIQFFFVSIAFAYFANHLRQRRFRTN